MVKRWIWRLVGILALGVAVKSGVADGLRNPPEGAAVLGRAGGRIVFNDDISAGLHNPAALSDIESPVAGASLTAIYGKRTFQSERYGFTVRSTDRWAYIPSLFASHPAGDHGYAYGVALTSPYGRSSSFSRGSPMRYLAPYASQLRTINLNPAVARRFGETVAVGAGFNVMWSDLQMQQLMPWSMIVADPMAPGDGELDFSADGVGYGFNLGLTWDFAPRQRVALTYRSAVKVDYDGDMTVSPVGGPTVMKSDFETDLTFPTIVAAGYGIRPTDTLALEANVEWVQHSNFDRLDLDAGDNNALLPASSIPADWRDNWTFGLGVDWQWHPEWSLRAGYMYLQSPVPSGTMIPLVAEASQSVVSLGTGFARGAHRLDLAYMLGIFDRRKVDANVNPDYNGTYEFDSHLVAIGYACQF